MFSRTEKVMGFEKLEKIKKSNIAVLGLGGVGGYVAELLARLGVGNLTIVDFDKIDKTNINRQIIALTTNIGEFKTDSFEKRIKEINPQCEVNKISQKITKENIQNILSQNFDYVIDAIDDISAKLETAKFCKKNKLKLISSMGTGNRYKEIPCFEVIDIYKTSYDKLAKKFRGILKENNIDKLDVVYTKIPSEENIDGVGSVAYYPFMCAGTIVSFVANKLLEE